MRAPNSAVKVAASSQNIGNFESLDWRTKRSSAQLYICQGCIKIVNFDLRRLSDEVSPLTIACNIFDAKF